MERMINTTCEHKKCIENHLLYSTAPVLTGAKPSTLISFKQCYRDVWSELKKHINKALGLFVIELYECKETFSVLVYNKEALTVRVRSHAAKEVLAKYGYHHTANLYKLLLCLKRRFNECKFPHEIGVFLGYPPEDVNTFIEKCGRDYLCCRYWKVYHNEEKAWETFRFIDQAKEMALSLLEQQMSLIEAANTLANMHANLLAI